MGKDIAEGKEPKRKRNTELFKKRQTEIIMTAAKLFMQKGYVQTSMREISEATGIDVSYLYHFIESKDDILFRVFEMIHRPALELFENPKIMNIDDPVKQLRAIIRAFIDFGYKYDQEVLLMNRESKALPRHLLKIILSRESYVIAQIEKILKKGLKKKAFQFEDSSFTANMVVYEFSVHALRHWNMKKYTKKDLVNLIEAHIMKAITA